MEQALNCDDYVSVGFIVTGHILQSELNLII